MKYIREFDGLRGLMALWVLVGHWTTTIFLTVPGPDNLSNTSAVDVFIILSGFAIATLIDRRQEHYGPYIVRRALRIFPVYWFYLALSIALAWVTLDVWSNAAGGAMRTSRLDIAVASIGHFWVNLATHIPALHAAVPSRLVPLGEFAFLGQAWSISLEWQFYLVAPFAIALLLAARRNIRTAVVLVLVLLALSVFSRYMPAGFIGRFSALFGVGIGTHYLLKWHHATSFIPAGRIAPLAILLIGIVLLLRLPSALPLSIWIATTAAVMAPERAGLSVLSRFLTLWPIEALGKMSYSIYLSHMIAMVLGMAVLRDLGIYAQFPHAVALLAITLCGTLMMSLFSYNLIEKPFQQMGKRMANGMAPAVRPACLPV